MGIAALNPSYELRIAALNPSCGLHRAYIKHNATP